MSIGIKKFEKQPGESLEYVFSFERWLAEKTGYAAASHTVTADAGLTVAHTRSGAVVTVIASGGTDGERYKVTVRLTTDGATPLVRELDAYISVKER
jgi:hypothetical protein